MIIIYKSKKNLQANVNYGTGKNANIYNKKFMVNAQLKIIVMLGFVGFDEKYIVTIWGGKDTSKGRKISGGGLPAKVLEILLINKNY